MKKLITTTMMLTMSLSMTNIYAEGEKGGNGGNTYHCGSQGNRLVDFELVRVLPMGQKMKIVRNQSSVESQIESAILKVSLIDQEVGTALRNQIEIIRSQLIDSSSLGIEWPVTADAGALPILTGCRTVNAIYYHSSQAIYQKKENMPQHPTDLAGLWIHEGVYKLMREQNRGNVESLPVQERAIPAQRLTALLFSDSQDAGLFKEMIERYLVDRTIYPKKEAKEFTTRGVKEIDREVRLLKNKVLKYSVDVQTNYPECINVKLHEDNLVFENSIVRVDSHDKDIVNLENHTRYQQEYGRITILYWTIILEKKNISTCGFPISAQINFTTEIEGQINSDHSDVFLNSTTAKVRHELHNIGFLLKKPNSISEGLQNLLSGEL